MDFDDSFTERLLQKNKVRKQFKIAKESETPENLIKRRPALIDEQQITNPVFIDKVDHSPKRPCDDLDDSPKRQCLEQCKGSPSRHWPPQKENIPSKGSAEESFVPFKSSVNVRGLAALKKIDDNGSNVINSKLTSEADVNNGRTYMFSTNSSDLCKGRKTRLADLAADINQWEDDLHQSKSLTNDVATSNSFKKVEVSRNASRDSHIESPIKIHTSSVQKSNKLFEELSCSADRDVKGRSPSKKSNFGSVGCEKISHKVGVWDQAIKATLETEEVKISPTKTLKAIDENREFIICKKGSSVNATKGRLEQIVKEGGGEDLNVSFDPTHLPISARKALFENGMQDVKKLKEHSVEPKLSVAQRAALFENAVQKSSVSRPVSNHKSKHFTPPQSPNKPSKVANVNVQSSSSSKSASQSKAVTPQLTASPVKKLVADTGAVEKMLLARINSVADTKQQTVEQDEKPIKGNNALVSYWENLSVPSKPVNSNSEEEMYDKHEDIDSETYHSDDGLEGYESETESRYEKESESECRYGKESETESRYEKDSESEYRYRNESETESRYEKESESEFNYNTEVTEEFSECETEAHESDHECESPLEEHVFKSPKGLPLSKANSSKTSNLNMKGTVQVVKKHIPSWKEDHYDEDSCDATSLSDGSSYAESTVSTDVRSAEACQSLCASSSSSVGSSYDPESSKESEENFAKTLSESSTSDIPLLYTVSFYRRQKQDTKTPPLKTIVRKEQIATPSPCNQTSAIQEQIKYYQEEINKQQTIIGQTSQALNLCIATAEFSGSSEQVEGERLLLIATQKRQALLNEIQRLKTHGAEGEDVPDGTGTLTISDLELPLKQEFLAAQLEGKINDAVHWFLCLIRYGAQVIVTQMVSTDDKISNGALCFTNHIKLQNLPPDFSIIFEVYALQTKKESLPHDKKYHIRRDKSTMRLTPKGRKTDNKLLLPGITSPGGPNAVRSPSFGVIGFTRFTIHNSNKKCFTLDKIPFTSPLEGILRVKLQLHAEHKVMEKGFLTMFEDVSGFGAWHRRWCALNAQHLTYWKYPDDENKKAPIGSIDLKQCTTFQVKPVSRDLCARPHTFQLVIVRPQSKGDKNTLTSQCSNTLTTINHLLSADTKEERILWCGKLNEALTNVRKWDPQALRPSEANQE